MSLVAGGKILMVRRHLWRGGHDTAMIAFALSANVSEAPCGSRRERAFTPTLANIGTSHYLPTGTPERPLTVDWRLLNKKGKLISRRRERIEYNNTTPISCLVFEKTIALGINATGVEQ